MPKPIMSSSSFELRKSEANPIIKGVLNKKQGHSYTCTHKVIEKGSSTLRVIWKNAFEENTNNDFSFEAKQGTQSNKQWTEITIDGCQLLGNIESIANRYGFERERIERGYTPEELGQLLKIMGCNKQTDIFYDEKGQAVSEREAAFIHDTAVEMTKGFLAKNGYLSITPTYGGARRNTERHIKLFLERFIFHQNDPKIDSNLKEEDKFLYENIDSVTNNNFKDQIQSALIRHVGDPWDTDPERNHLLQGRDQSNREELIRQATERAKKLTKDPSKAFVNILIYKILNERGETSGIWPPPLARIAIRVLDLS